MQEIIWIDLGGVNCYLLKENGQFMLVDTGGHIVMDKEFHNRRKELEAQLNQAGCNKENLKLLVLTHGDNDHVCNASFIKKKYGAAIAAHRGDKKLINNPDMADYMSSFHYFSFIYKLVFRIMRKKIAMVTEKCLNDYEKVLPDIWLEDGMSLESYGFHASILHLPGHTKGSVGILTENGLFAGDLLANNKKPIPAMNGDDFHLIKNSIKRLKQYPIQTIYPGHGKPFAFQELKI